MSATIFRTASGMEVLTIYYWPGQEGCLANYTVTMTSRRIDPATPEALREYAAAWAEAADWLAGADEHPGAAIPVGYAKGDLYHLGDGLANKNL